MGEKMDNSPDDNSCFSRAGPGKDKSGPRRSGDRFELLGIQAVEIGGRRFGKGFGRIHDFRGDTFKFPPATLIMERAG